MVGYSFNTHEDAVAFRDQLNAQVGLPSGGTTDLVDLIEVGELWVVGYCTEAEELLGPPQEFEIEGP